MQLQLESPQSNADAPNLEGSGFARRDLWYPIETKRFGERAGWGLCQMATIKDVARVAGVSIATVSATLNGTARVSEKRSRRIWDAIKAVGYTPHGIARSLRLGHTRSIGLVVGDISNPFFTSLSKAVEARASAAGDLGILGNSDENPEKEISRLQFLLDQRV